MPEFCVSCGSPTEEASVGALYYEGDFYAGFNLVRHGACPDDATMLLNDLTQSETLPPRQRTAFRSRAR